MMNDKEFKGMKALNSRMGSIKRIVLLLAFVIFLIQPTTAILYNQHQYLRLDNHTTRIVTIVNYPDASTIVPDYLGEYDLRESFFFNMFDLNYHIKTFQQVYAGNKSIIDAITGYQKDAYPFQFYIQYDVNNKLWNSNAGNYTINYCDINVTYYKYFPAQVGNSISASVIPLFSRRFGADEDITNNQYFVLLNRGDYAGIIFDCYFDNSQYRTIELPINTLIISPTHECKLCQYYKWTAELPDYNKAEFLEASTTAIYTYMKKIAFINYEFFVMIFYTTMIILIIFIVSLVFLGAYYLYLYVRKHLK